MGKCSARILQRIKLAWGAANPADYIVIARKHLWRAGIRLPGSIVLPVLVCLAARTGASLVWHSTFPDWQGGIQDGNPPFLRSRVSGYSSAPGFWGSSFPGFHYFGLEMGHSRWTVPIWKWLKLLTLSQDYCLLVSVPLIKRTWFVKATDTVWASYIAAILIVQHISVSCRSSTAVGQGCSPRPAPKIDKTRGAKLTADSIDGPFSFNVIRLQSMH